MAVQSASLFLNPERPLERSASHRSETIPAVETVQAMGLHVLSDVSAVLIPRVLSAVLENPRVHVVANLSHCALQSVPDTTVLFVLRTVPVLVQIVSAVQDHPVHRIAPIMNAVHAVQIVVVITSLRQLKKKFESFNLFLKKFLIF